MNARQAARIGHCHQSTIARLVRDGKIQAEKTGRSGPRASYRILTPKDEIRAIVMKETPRAGFHMRARVASNGKGPFHSVVVKPKVTTTPKRSNALHSFFEWAKLTDMRRAILLELNNKFTEEELQILLSL